MNWLSVILTWISEWINVILTALVALFTGLYWWNARRSFLLELDRVVLWFRLEEEEDIKKGELNELIDEGIDKIIDEGIDKSTEPDELVRELLKIRRGKMQEKLRKEVRKKVREELAIDKIASDSAFFDTLKSKSLGDRLKKYKKKLGELRLKRIKSKKK